MSFQHSYPIFPQYQSGEGQQTVSEVSNHSDLSFILDAARWAPSGDNSQPWTFKVIDDENVSVSLKFEEGNVYEYNHGQPVFLACGALIETMRIAASCRQRGCEICDGGVDPNSGKYVLNIKFPKSATVEPSALYQFIRERSVNRGRFQTVPLTLTQVELLEQSLGSSYAVQWHTTFREKLKIIGLHMMGTGIRIRIPETYPIHARVIDWREENSVWGIPASATGFSTLTKNIMRWALKDRKHTTFMNAIGAHLAIQMELDVITGLQCARHFTLFLRDSSHEWPSDRQIMEAGSAVQRFWLTATALGLSVQPLFQSLIFSAYAQQKVKFTSDEKQKTQSERLLAKAKKIWTAPVEAVFFQGRIGTPNAETSRRPRSVRKPLDELMVER